MEQKSTKRQISFWLDSTDAEALDKAAKKTGVSTAAFLRLLIKQWTDGIIFEPKREGKDGS